VSFSLFSFGFRSERTNEAQRKGQRGRWSNLAWKLNFLLWVFLTVRSSEEVLEETKKRRRAVGSRSEREEKKLVKMSAEVSFEPLSFLFPC